MTRREWFETLPPAYAERAIRNTTPAKDLDDPCSSLASAVGGGFIWVHTPEGDSFWGAVQQGELPPIPGEEPAPEYPEPPTGFAVVMGPLARLATEYEQRDIAGRMSDGWIGQGLSLTSSTWTGCDEGFPYALRIGSQLAIDNGLSGIPDTQPTTPAAPASPAAGEFRVRPGYRYRTRGGATTGYLRRSDGRPGSSYEFEADLAGCVRTFTARGQWNPPGDFNFDLVEEVTPTTIEEWLHTIPESEEALRNMESRRGGWYHEHTASADSAYDAVGRGFGWGDTPEGHDYWQEVHRRLVDEHRSGARSATALRPTPAAHPATRARAAAATPPTPPPAPKAKYRITEVRHYFLEAEDEIEADKMFRDASDPARKFRMHIEDREVHNDA